MYNRLVKLILESGSKPCKACGHPAHQVRKGAKRGFKRYECGSTKVGGVAGSKCQFAWSEKPKVHNKVDKEKTKVDNATPVEKLKSWANKTGVKRKGIDEALSGASRSFMNHWRNVRKLRKNTEKTWGSFKDSDNDDETNNRRSKWEDASDKESKATDKAYRIKNMVPTKAKRNRERVRAVISRHTKAGTSRGIIARLAKARRSVLKKSQID